MPRTSEEIVEIERHKYFLSEKQGFDVGWEFAEKDWETNYGEQFRRWHAQKETTADAAQRLADVEQQNTMRLDDLPRDTGPTPTYTQGGLRGLVWRLLHRS